MKPPASFPAPHLHRPLARSCAALLAALVVAVAAAPGTADAQRRAKRPPEATATAPSINYATRPEVSAFVAEMVEQHGFIEAELLEMFEQVRRNDDAVRLMSPAPSGFKRSWQSYRSRFLDGLRIREGLRFWREHEPWLELAAQRFGVPPEIVVAIIGVETIYGRNTGDFRVLDVLTTLAFD
ncbi:MAG TPA: lytic murein transglycosylase, partial [Burkholderiaceae bacterium]|nr:lytic murein transglycosylase [Burkholderiaceae bacterium]